ncbi:MAG: response regulator [Cyclobacteriaceae bacterium]
MDNLFIVCVDDQREVLNALTADLEALEPLLQIEECESVSEAWDVIESIDQEGNHLALVITDQVMPENSGVDLLKKLSKDYRFDRTKTILLTGQATHKDTIDAINTAQLDHYVEKPWNREALLKMIKTLITKYLLGAGIDYSGYTSVIDQETLLANLRKTT